MAFGNPVRLVMISIVGSCLLMLSAFPADTAQQSTDARSIAANAEMGVLADALTRCAFDTGFYVSLETLNDVTFQHNPDHDHINFEGGTWVIRPNKGRFESERVDLPSASLAWDGPYVNYQPGTTQIGSEPYDLGSPLDPWGSPYYFFTPLGLARGDEGEITQELYGDLFDRPTIVSLGSDAIQSGDDQLYQFGSGVSVLSISSLVGSGVQNDGRNFFAVAGSSIVLRGYAFAETQGDAAVLFDSIESIELADVRSWSPTRIEVMLPSALEGVGQVSVKRGAAQSNALSLTVGIPRASVAVWSMYP